MNQTISNLSSFGAGAMRLKLFALSFSHIKYPNLHKQNGFITASKLEW